MTENLFQKEIPSSFCIPVDAADNVVMAAKHTAIAKLVGSGIVVRQYEYQQKYVKGNPDLTKIGVGNKTLQFKSLSMMNEHSGRTAVENLLYDEQNSVLMTVNRYSKAKRSPIYVCIYSWGPIDGLDLWKAIKKDHLVIDEPGDVTGRWLDFVNFGADGTPKNERRRVPCHKWEAVKANYTATSGESFERLVKVNQPKGTGRLILLHGNPGTGKSHAIRTLVDEWRKWAYFRYILDPEYLLTNPSYLMKMIDSDPENVSDDGDDEDGDDEGIPKWPILVMEDAGNFIARDANESSGLAFSRLLNAADGLVGDGFNCLIIITTNERMELHKAISRPGRCLADIEFGKLTPTEANAWLEANRGKAEVSPVTSSVTLADLYNMVSGGTISNECNEGVGFHR